METQELEIVMKDKDNELEKEYIKSNDIICSECKETCLINIKDYKFNLFGCKNNHNIKNISLENFEECQEIQKIKKICQ